MPEHRGLTLPDTLKIGGHTAKIIFPYLFTERSDLCGQYDKDAGLIRLSAVDCNGNDRVDSEIVVSLLHEILHAIDHCTGHRLFSGEEGEKHIEGLSEGLFQVLNDNGLLNLKINV